LRPAIRKVAQRFATDVLVGENAGQGRFVQSVCVEADLTLETARLLSDDPDPQPALDRMGADGLLRRQEQDGESRYSWLPVARRLIRDAVGARRPQSLAALDLRLVHWYRESGRPDRALSHAAGTGDWPLVVRIIESAWRPLLFEHNDLLLHVITMVPYEAFRGSVAAAAAREVLLRVPADIATGSDADTEGTTARSRRELLAMGASPNVQRILDAELMSMVVARRRGLFARARRTSDEIAVIADAAGACRTAEVSGLLPLVYLQSGLTRLLARDTEGATTHLSEAFRLGPEGDHAFVEREAAGKLALVFALTGDIKRAQRWTMRLEDDVPLAPWLRPLVRNSGDLAQALVAIDRLAPESAIAALDRINDTIYNDELWAYGVYVQARYALLWGDPMAALAVLRRERERHADWHTLDSDALPMLAATEVNLLIAMGQGSYVRAVLTAAGRAHPELLLAWARFDLLTGDPDRALASVLNVIFAEPTSQRLRTEAQLLQAVARHRLGDIETAREVFRRVVRNIKDQDALAYFSMVPREDLFSLAEDVRDTAALIGGSSGRGVPVVFPASLDVVRLTEREQVVLERLAEYRSAPEIATSLYVSVHTVKSQVGSLYRKLGVNSRDHAVLAAREMGLLR
jgi:LuxR family maltose regulon positive regulatory protein